jgi:hypothetical protein
MLHTKCYRERDVGLWPKEVRATVDRAADKLADTAADTRAAMAGLAVLGLAALGVALMALAVSMRRQ